MAKAIANCTCSACGKKFVKTSFLRNRADADSWTVWAEANMDECSDCYAARKKAENARIAAAFDLPEITGASPKQIAYANDLRNRCVGEHKEIIEIVFGMIERMQAPDFAERCKAAGIEPEEALANTCKKHNFFKEYICVRKSDARTIIDELR